MVAKEVEGRAHEQNSEAKVTNGLYVFSIEMREGKRGRANGVVMLYDGRIMGGDSNFYYTGNYTFRNGKWRGDLMTHQHTEAKGKNLAFGGHEVSCGFTGNYFDDRAEVHGTALVGRISVSFRAELALKSEL